MARHWTQVLNLSLCAGPSLGYRLKAVLRAEHLNWSVIPRKAVAVLSEKRLQHWFRQSLPDRMAVIKRVGQFL